MTRPTSPTPFQRQVYYLRRYYRTMIITIKATYLADIDHNSIRQYCGCTSNILQSFDYNYQQHSDQRFHYNRMLCRAVHYHGYRSDHHNNRRSRAHILSLKKKTIFVLESRVSKVTTPLTEVSNWTFQTNN